MSANENTNAVAQEPSPQGAPVPVGSPLYNQILTFLYEEANLLDNIRLKEWAACLAQDLVYTVPLRQTRLMAEHAASVVRSVQHYHDDYRSIMGRIMRLTETKSAWAEDPPSRTRRLVSNLMVHKGARDNEFEIRSNLLLTRSRFDHTEVDIISGERHDLLRLENDSFLLARRDVILDQAVLGTANLAIFL